MEFALTPHPASSPPDARAVLALAAVVGDDVLGCGGALALHSQTGLAVTTLTLVASSDPQLTRSVQRESERAAQMLGLSAPIHWALAEQGVYATESLIARASRLIDSLGVDLLYAPSLWEAHPDRRQTALLARAIVQRSARPIRLMHYELGQPLLPNALIDITPVAGLKQQAMRCFASQMETRDLALQMDALNRYRTYSLGPHAKAAEAFALLPALKALAPQAASAPDQVTLGPDVESVAAWRACRPKVSILIRSADRPFLHQALDSVALQTHGALEVLIQAVVPDHSPVPQCCGPYPVTMLPTDQPLSRSEAANALLQAAQGSWLLFLDDDDWLMPSHIARLADALAAQRSALAGYTGVMLVNERNVPTGAVFDIPYDPSRWLAGNLTPIHAVLFHRDLVDQGCRFDTALDRYEDWDFWLQLGRHTVFLHLPGVSAAYRIHHSSGVHTDSGASSDSSAVIHDKWASHWNGNERRGLMERVWAFADLEQKLLDSQRTLDALQALRDSEPHSRPAPWPTMAPSDGSGTAVSAPPPQEHHAQREKERAALEQQLAEARGLVRRLSADMTAIKASKSWRVTAPLRGLVTRLRRLPWRHVSRKFRRAVQILRDEGPQSLAHRLTHQPQWVNPDAIPYAEWMARCESHDVATLAKQRQQTAHLHNPVTLSVVMPVYNPPLDLLEQAVASVQGQTYPHWELCIADDASTDPRVWPTLQALAAEDARIRLTQRTENGHISHASNSALALARGDFIALMDNDDLLPPDALYWVADAIARHPQVRLIYSDEDKLGPDGQRFGAYMKPAWNHTLFLGHNMISHLGVYERELVEEVGGFRPGYEGSQDYDLALRCISRIRPDQVVHIPRVLYHWRVLPGSTALAADEKPYALTSAQRALQEHLDDAMPGACVEITPSWNYRVIPPAVDPSVHLTVVVLSDQGRFFNHDRLRHHLRAIRCRQLLLSEPSLQDLRSTLARCDTPLVALLHEALTPLADDALDDMCAHALRPGVAAVTGAVFNRQNQLIDGAWTVDPQSGPAVLHHRLPLHHPGYMGRAQLAQEVSAMGFACAVFRRPLLIDRDWPTHGAPSASATLQWCARVRSAGHVLVWLPSARWRAQTWGSMPVSAMTTSSNGAAPSPQACDPAYHPCLDGRRGDFSLCATPKDQLPRLGTPPDGRPA